MKHAIATLSLSGDIEEKLHAIADAGYAGVEICESDMQVSEHSAARIGSHLRALGLECIALQPFRDFEGLTCNARQRAFDRAHRKFDLMQELGAPLLLICSTLHPDALGEYERHAEDLAELGEAAAARRLKIGYEALSWGRFTYDHRQAWRTVQLANHDAVGIVLDTFHSLARDVPVESIADIDGKKIFLVQVADAPRLQMDHLSWSRHFRCLPGQGQFDLASYLRAVHETGYDGFYSLEIFNDQQRIAAARISAQDGKRSLLFLDEQANLSDKPMPAPPPIDGVEFVEFAMSDGDAAAFTPVLEALGFVRCGRHISKRVDRWAQGEVNIVLNRQVEEFARAYNLVHGASVCALGLRFDDAAAVYKRATALLAAPFEQEPPSGQLSLAAIRGVGGSLIYVLDKAACAADLWDTEFSAEQPLPEQVFVNAFDHISHSVPHEQLLSWLLFYKSVFGLHEGGDAKVADPQGIIHSRVLESDGGALRLNLNSSESAHTSASRFIDASGAGVQHIALRTDDIFVVAARLRERGQDILQVPLNYYLDLEARFSLDPAFTARLQANNILYDRDGEGEYLQLYVPAMTNGFFFEIVSRDAYRGYGGANAPVRLASQHRRRRTPIVD